MLPPVAAINGARIRVLTGDDRIPDSTQISLRAFRAAVGERTFHVGFSIGDGERFSAIGIAVIERLTMEAPGAPLHVVPIVHEDIAWDMVLRHLRSFAGQVLLFAFPDSDAYDAGTAETFYSDQIRQFDEEGVALDRGKLITYLDDLGDSFEEMLRDKALIKSILDEKPLDQPRLERLARKMKSSVDNSGDSLMNVAFLVKQQEHGFAIASGLRRALDDKESWLRKLNNVDKLSDDQVAEIAWQVRASQEALENANGELAELVKALKQQH